jgi:hypothetical protein
LQGPAEYPKNQGVIDTDRSDRLEEQSEMSATMQKERIQERAKPLRVSKIARAEGSVDLFHDRLNSGDYDRLKLQGAIHKVQEAVSGNGYPTGGRRTWSTI